MSFQRKLANVFIFVLFIFFVVSNSIGAEEAADKEEAAYTKEFGVMSGWAWGDLKTQKDYEMVPLYVQMGFDIKPLLSKVHLKPPGSLNFLFEPFLNTITSPDANIETGVNFIFKYRHPLTRKFHVFIEGGAGLLWTSQHTFEQATQFNFDELYGGGLSFFFAENKSFNVGYRYRHYSNAGIEEPNAGIDLKFITAGISFYY